MEPPWNPGRFTSALWDRVVVRVVVAVVVVGALVLAGAPMTKWEQEQAAGNTWAVSVGEAPSRRPPVIELMRSQDAASVYDPIVLRAAGRRLLLSVTLLLIATVMAFTAATRRKN